MSDPRAAPSITRRSLLAGVGMWPAAALAQGSVFPPPVKLDVPYVPTPQDVVERMLAIARVGKDDFMMDLGCGDGRMLVTAAAKFGARGYGVDINPARIEEARENAHKAGVQSLVEFEVKDLFKTPIERASVLAMYLLPSVMLQLRPRILAEMRPGSRIVSHDFDMAEWEPDFHETTNDHEIFYWVVPGRAEGVWRIASKAESYTLSLRQKFQKLEGALHSGSDVAVVRDGRLNGEGLRFAAEFGDGSVRIFSGRLTRDGIVADTPSHIVTDWSAVRAQ